MQFGCSICGKVVRCVGSAKVRYFEMIFDQRLLSVESPCLIGMLARFSDELQEFSVKAGTLTKLPKPVQQIIGMIFDVDSMNSILRDFEIDTEKMPLGRLSKRHLQNAYKVLTELQNVGALKLLTEAGNATYANYLDATNRFFTLIPHNFGMNKPPLLNTAKLLSVSMRDSFMLHFRRF
ncbi:unnamed protein product [Gongylonema pulchrum]|uniref:NAD(+) ADP-ribosyltransferase n=1 Tax=Gongylonema pulchrum TaxID=637853 RepID=A0A183DMI1_9BILA|nr:unnamed protein product [Gongylonema pulchrum]